MTPLQSPADPDMFVNFVLIIVTAMAASGLVGMLWTQHCLLLENRKLTETNRVLALGYANPDAAFRLTQQQSSQANAKRDAVLNQIKLAQTREARTQAQRNVAARNRPPREFPSLRYHNPVDDDIVSPKSKDKK